MLTATRLEIGRSVVGAEREILCCVSSGVGVGHSEALLTAEHDAALRAAFGRGWPDGRSGGRSGHRRRALFCWAVVCVRLPGRRQEPVRSSCRCSARFCAGMSTSAGLSTPSGVTSIGDASAQAAFSASYGRDAATGLVRGFAGDAARCRPDMVRRGGEQRRSRLARLLFRLLDGAGLATFRYGQTRTIAEQFTALRRAAASVELEDKMPVSSALCTYRPALQEFIDRVASMPASAFRKTGNPHGVFIGVARFAARGVVEPARGDPIAVAGEIAIFGERDGRDDRDAGVICPRAILDGVPGRAARATLPRRGVTGLSAPVHGGALVVSG